MRSACFMHICSAVRARPCGFPGSRQPPLMATRQQSRQCEPLLALFRLLFGSKDSTPAAILPLTHDEIAYPKSATLEPAAEKPNHTGTGLARAGATALQAFKLSLRVTKEASVAFPPLQAAVSGLLALIAEIEVSDCVCSFHSQTLTTATAERG